MHTIENTLFMGKVLLHFDSLESTNDYAIELISKSKPAEGTVISAYNQTRGRGQIGSKWWSEPHKNLTFSVVLYPTFLDTSRQFLLSQAIALGVLDFLNTLINTGLSLKWPNDIYHNDNKLGGILLQSSLKGSNLMWCVAGIGLNVNQVDFNKDLPNPTSIQLITGQSMDVMTLMASLCRYLEFRYLQLNSGQDQQIKSDYLQHCYRFMEEALFERPSGEIFNGKMVGVDDTGKLLVVHQNGEEAFAMKEIRFV